MRRSKRRKYSSITDESESRKKMVIIKEITLKNFKSFKGETKVGIPRFAAVVGSNGAGKSNFTDAICFTTGVSASYLRVSRIRDLVYRSNSGEYEQNMSVFMTLEASDGALTSFERSFQAGCCRYRINDNIVSHSDYVETLKTLGIDGHINNFVVFQNSIEKVITKSPMERTALFEEISGSVFHAAEYKRLKCDVMRMDKELECLYQMRRAISVELKRVLYSRENAHEYQILEEKYNEAQVHLLLFNLHCAERDIRKWSEMIEDIEPKILALESEKDEAVKRLDAAKKALTRCKREAAFMEENLMETKESDIERNCAAADAEIKHAENKVNTCRASLEAARKDDEARVNSVERLRKALRSAEKAKDDHCQRYAQVLAIDSELLESQHEEYERLRALCWEKFAVDHERLMLLEWKYNSVEDDFVVARQKTNELQSSVNRKYAARIDAVKLANKIEESMKKIERELETKQKRQEELYKSIESSSAKTRAITEELEDIARQIGEDKLGEHIKKKNQLVKDLKQLYPGVLDRLRNMYTAIHERYNLAVTKVLGPHLDSIVVDTSETAMRCIEHLKNQCVDIDTFLPLDNIAVIPIKQQLRAIKSSPNVKLVYDVIAFDCRIDRVIKFVTGNTLVAETPEDAAEIAFAARKSNDCVSVDGTLYRTSGLITGGSHDLDTTRAQRSDSSLMMNLLSRKGELTRALREIRRELPKPSEMSILDLEIFDLQRNLRDSNRNYRAATKKVSDFEQEMQDPEDKFDTSIANSDEVQSRMDRLSKEVDDLKSKIIEEEKEYYADFCQTIGLDDIRHYENRQKLCKEELQTFCNQIDCIKRQLDFEMARDTAENVLRWTCKLSEAESILKSAIDARQKIRDKLVDYEKRAHESQVEYTSVQKKSEEIAEEWKKLKSQVQAISKEHINLTSQRSALQLLIHKKKAHRHTLLIDAKVHGLKIPLITDPPNNSSKTRDSPQCSLSTIDSSEAYELEGNARYDFSKLPSDILKLERTIDIRTAREKLEKNVSDIDAAIDKLADPNMKASQQAEMLKDELAQTKSKIRRTSKNLRKIAFEFTRVKGYRYDKFMEFFEHTVEQVDVIYKKITRSSSAQAFFVPENPEEPYLAGIHFHCIAPGKRFHSTSALSGGEKAVAALSVICSMDSKSPTFKVLDEIDTALDSKAATKVVKYLDENKHVQQSIVTSHKKEVIAGADAILGIYNARTADGGHASGIISFDLSCFQR